MLRNGDEELSKSRGHGLPVLALFLLVVFTCRDIPAHDFLTVWDDPQYITGNPFIRGFSWLNLKAAFTRYFLGNFAPVQIVSYMVDYTLWGLKPTGFFLANILYHFMSGILLYLLLLRFDIGKLGSLCGAAIFLVHPAQVENVAWLSQRKSLLAVLLFLAAFHFYLNFREREPSGRFWYGLSLAAFLLSLLAKSATVIFPLVLLYQEVLTSQPGDWRRRIRDLLPFGGAALCVGIVAVLAQSPELGGGRVGYPDNPLLVMPLTMLTVLVDYLRIIFWPSPDRLSLIYDPPYRAGFDGTVLAALGVGGILAATGWWLRRQARPALFWYGLFFLGLLPVSQVVPLLTIMNDRYLNLPLLGIAGLAGCAVERFGHADMPALAKRGLVTVAVCTLVALACSFHVRSLVWRDAVTLFSDTVPKVTTMHKPWLMLGEAYEKAGDAVSAEISYQQSELSGPLTESDYIVLGNLFLARRDFIQARTYLSWLRGQDGHELSVRFLAEALATADGEK